MVSNFRALGNPATRLYEPRAADRHRFDPPMNADNGKERKALFGVYLETRIAASPTLELGCADCQSDESGERKWRASIGVRR